MSSGTGESGDVPGPNSSDSVESQSERPEGSSGNPNRDAEAGAAGSAGIPESGEQIAPAAGGESGPESGDDEPERVRDPLDTFPVSWLNSDGEPEQGPMYVLWELIESYKVDIFEVSLHRITEDFLNFLRRAGELQVELASSFTVMASRLLYYKSRALLPDPGFEESDEESRLPPELVQQLLEYRKFQFAAERLGDLDETSAGMLTRKTGLVPDTGSAETNEWLDASLVDLIQAYSNVLNRASGAEDDEEDQST